MTDREIMQQALHHLVDLADDLRRIPNDIAQTILALEAALAQPEQEPVKKALRLEPHECICGYSVGHPLIPKCICKPEYTAQPEQEPVAWQNLHLPDEFYDHRLLDPSWYSHYRPLYTAPQRKKWVGLTDDDVAWADGHSHGNTTWTKQKAFARAIEAKLKEKNGG